MKFQMGQNWVEEDRQRALRMDRLYVLDGRHRLDHPMHGLFTGFGGIKKMPLAQWLIVQPSLEEELTLEKDVREVLNNEDHEDIKKLCAVLLKQSFYRSRVLNQAVAKIDELEKEMNKRRWFKLG